MTLEIAFVLVAAFGAGFIDAMAGGGGLVQLPALFAAFPAAPHTTLLGTGKLAGLAGGALPAALELRPGLPQEVLGLCERDWTRQTLRRSRLDPPAARRRQVPAFTARERGVQATCHRGPSARRTSRIHAVSPRLVALRRKT